MAWGLSISVSLPDARFRRGQRKERTDDWMHRPLSKAPGCFNWEPAYTLVVTVVIPRWFYVIRLFRYRGREAHNGPNRSDRWELTDSGWSAEGQKQQVCMLWPALPSQEALCFAFAAHVRPLPDRPTEDHHAVRHGFLRGSRATPRVASYHYIAYLDDLIGELMQQYSLYLQATWIAG